MPAPFKIQVSEDVLTDLKRRLAATRWPDSIEGSDWDLGTDPAYLKELCGYWQNGFDWRKQEESLNRFKQFKHTVDVQELHYIHERGEGSNAIPLLLLHGWPSSFWQMTKIVPLLTKGDRGQSFDVIAPSLPGYGFSPGSTKPGMNVSRMADLFAGLMKDLGYDRFGMRAGDIGAGVARELAKKYPERVIGFHTSGLWADPFNPPKDATEEEMKFLKDLQGFFMKEGAYAMEQMTKPQTLAMGLNDSPAGLAAWIVEKLRAWSDCGGDVEKRFSKDELLTNLTIYWATQTIGSSVRLYAENAMDKNTRSQEKLGTPTAYAQGPADLAPGPRSIADRLYNVVRWTELPRGGHFIEWEEPELVAEDLRGFFGSL